MFDRGVFLDYNYLNAICFMASKTKKTNKKDSNQKTRLIGVRLTEDVYDMIQSKADNVDRSLSNYIRWVLSQHLVDNQKPRRVNTATTSSPVKRKTRLRR